MSKDFNSRPSARGDVDLEALRQKLRISIHAPPRGATPAVLRVVFLPFVFQFTPLREGRPEILLALRLSNDFNSRPSARGDGAPPEPMEATPAISIHAPPRGATRRRRQWKPLRQFQFTPLREGRRGSHSGRQPRRRNFNSRPSARGDMTYHIDKMSWFHISIHAPPRGATGSHSGRQPRRRNFNSRPSARGDTRY